MATTVIAAKAAEAVPDGVVTIEVTRDQHPEAGTGATRALSSTTVDARIVFSSALLLGTASILVAHNHPSGSSVPSAEDRSLTKRLVADGELLDLRVLDNLILGHDVYSFAERGELR